MPRSAIPTYLRAFLRQQFGITLDALRHIRGAAARARLRGQMAGLAALPRFIRKRRTVQARQRLQDAQFLTLLGR